MFNINNKISTYFTPCFTVSIVNFEHVNAGWGILLKSNLSPFSMTSRIEVSKVYFSVLIVIF